MSQSAVVSEWKEAVVQTRARLSQRPSVPRRPVLVVLCAGRAFKEDCEAYRRLGGRSCHQLDYAKPFSEVIVRIVRRNEFSYRSLREQVLLPILGNIKRRCGRNQPVSVVWVGHGKGAYSTPENPKGEYWKLFWSSWMFGGPREEMPGTYLVSLVHATLTSLGLRGEMYLDSCMSGQLVDELRYYPQACPNFKPGGKEGLTSIFTACGGEERIAGTQFVDFLEHIYRNCRTVDANGDNLVTKKEIRAYFNKNKKQIQSALTGVSRWGRIKGPQQTRRLGHCRLVRKMNRYLLKRPAKMVKFWRQAGFSRREARRLTRKFRQSGTAPLIGIAAVSASREVEPKANPSLMGDAVFTTCPPQAWLSVYFAGNPQSGEMQTVTSSPPGIRCHIPPRRNSRCSHPFPPGSSVTLTFSSTKPGRSARWRGRPNPLSPEWGKITTVEIPAEGGRGSNGVWFYRLAGKAV